jgi:hypothetical protein
VQQPQQQVEIRVAELHAHAAIAGGLAARISLAQSRLPRRAVDDHGHRFAGGGRRRRHARPRGQQRRLLAGHPLQVLLLLAQLRTRLREAALQWHQDQHQQHGHHGNSADAQDALVARRLLCVPDGERIEPHDLRALTSSWPA